MANISNVFANDGLLSKAIEGFQPRPAQMQMAEAIASMADAHPVLIVEAETGTGKTFAYLAPALMAKGEDGRRPKVIVSTGTKNLQEQLFHRDLPKVRDVLAADAVVALLKGRNNYLCIQRMEQFVQQPSRFDPQYLAQMQQQARVVKQWSNQTRSGDLGELTELPEDAIILPQITSTADNCLGRECPAYDDCYVVKARQKALEADVVVVNHHLFFADAVLKDTGFGELIPQADMVIFDEAHQVPDIASNYFSESLSTRQLAELGQDLRMLYRTELKDLKQLESIADQLEKGGLDLRLQFARDPERGNWRDAHKQTAVASDSERLTTTLQRAYDIVKASLGRNKVLDQCYERILALKTRWQQLTNTARTGYSFWYETTSRHLTVHQTPLSVADKFAEFIQRQQARWVFTSATLAVDGDFSHFSGRLGLQDAQTLVLSSPFDFSRQAMLYMPRYLPQPSDPAMAQHILQLARELIAVNHGGTFLLFTSYRMLNQVAAVLQVELDRTVLVQGQTSKRELLDQFVAAGDAVLLGTSSFWEGVDVRGDALRLVIIDKLPFAAPDDPLLQARIEDCKLRGQNPFNQVQLPQAVISLKQGAGRLIRDAYDYGALVVCDNRLVTKQYGRIFLNSLPAMARTRSLPVVKEFLARESDDARAEQQEDNQ
ncbi:ATP-dependent helicase [Aliidiomarina sedimenti]|uniref:DNA 5'-3' helicase n=1 Tax=Aliidiomarina sedimenti TaxID=1933879 RepID=A0ABY0BX73_9GAMM|nr:ATP-dependent DNA helicase [Aliidiomarina sedimenti]RUO28917.1 ATP-dependent helicase [Aliidiomarina sedimenti]